MHHLNERPTKNWFLWFLQSCCSPFFYLTIVTTLAFGLRVIHLHDLPLSLSLDEAVDGLDALLLFRRRWLAPFLQNNFGRETLFFYIQGIGLSLYGVSIFAFRFVSALTATLTIPLVYVVGRRLGLEDLAEPEAGQANASEKNARATLPKRSGSDFPLASLLAATGLAISYWHIYFSRVGLRAILLLPLLLALIWCFWRGWFPCDRWPEAPSWFRPGLFHLGRRGWLVAAGFLLGLTFYSYLAARLLPLLFIAFIAVELIRQPANCKQRIIDGLLFGGVTSLTLLPLAFYFQQNPQAWASRTQAISVLAGEAPLEALAGNMVALLHIHFLAHTWLGQWPALNLLSALGLLVGLLVCLAQLKKPAALFLLLWWLTGTAPILFSRQDWSATTTLLRGIMAWPAMFLISAVGLAWLSRRLAAWYMAKRQGEARQAGERLILRREDRSGLPRLSFSLWFLLLFGGLTSTYHYFFVWATTYNNFSDHPPYLAHYLNRQTTQLTLTPVKFYAETVAYFLLQDRYPALTNIDLASLRSLLASQATTLDGEGEEQTRSTVYLLPHESTAEAAFVLLVPNAAGQGVAYLLPSLSPTQLEALTDYSQATSPLATVLDREQEPIAQVYPLPSTAPFLEGTGPVMQPVQANFKDEVLLTGYRVEPGIVKPGQTVTLHLTWQARRAIDGDPYVFIHLFDIRQGQRQGQINTPLTGLLFDAHRWPVGLTIPAIYQFDLPSTAVEGAYRFEIGLYHPASGQRWPVTISASPSSVNQTSPGAVDDKIILGKLQVGQQSPPPPDYLVAEAQFAGQIALLGVDLPSLTLDPGQPLAYTLHWQALAPISQNYTVFTHFLDSAGQIQAQQDNIPQQGRYPTSWWDPGEIILDPYTLHLPPDLAPGVYTLRVGLYDAGTGQRLSLENGGQDFVDLPVSIGVNQNRP